MRDLALVHGKQRKADKIIFFFFALFGLSTMHGFPSRMKSLVVGGAPSSLCCRAIKQANKIKKLQMFFSVKKGLEQSPTNCYSVNVPILLVTEKIQTGFSSDVPHPKECGGWRVGKDLPRTKKKHQQLEKEHTSVKTRSKTILKSSVKSHWGALAAVTQWIECQPVN